MTLNGQNCTFVMTSVSGHLLNYDFLQCFRSWYDRILSSFDLLGTHVLRQHYLMLHLKRNALRTLSPSRYAPIESLIY